MKVVVLPGLCLLLTFLLSFTTKSITPTSYSITLTVKKIRNTSGMMQIQVYRDQATFEKETPYKIYRVSKKDVKNGTLTYTIKDPPKGTYGLALLDDENSNKKMDYGLVMPKEGFGFGNYYHTGWSRPVFDDFKFDLNSNKSVIAIIRYV